MSRHQPDSSSRSRSGVRPARRSRSSPDSRSQRSAAATVSATGRSRSPARWRRVVAAGHEAGVGRLRQPQRQRLLTRPRRHARARPARRRRPRRTAGSARPPRRWRASTVADGRGVPHRVDRPRPAAPRQTRTSQSREVLDVDDLHRSVPGRHQDRLAVLGARHPRRPVAEPVAAVAVPGDQAGPGGEHPVGAHRVDGRRARRPPWRGRTARCRPAPVPWCGASSGASSPVSGHVVVGVHRPRGDVDPVPGARGERGQRGPHLVRLPADVQDRVPGASAHLVVRRRLVAVGADPGHARGRLAGLAARQAGHPVPARDGLPGDGAAQPGGATEDEQVEGGWCGGGVWSCRSVWAAGTPLPSLVLCGRTREPGSTRHGARVNPAGGPGQPEGY